MLTAIDLLNVDKELCKRSLAYFVKEAWHVIHPAEPLVWGWSMQAVCDHLQAITEGKITRLIINIPPGFSKSLLVCVFWPMWEWGPRGLTWLKYISVAHNSGVSDRDSLRSRDLLSSEWYQARWPVKLKDDQNQKTYFETTERGFRQASSMNVTGKRGNRILVDDPISVKESNSAAVIEEASHVWRSVLPNRINNPDTDAIVLIMQRVDVNDPTGIALDVEPGVWQHLCLPMEYEPERPCKTSIFTDPRTKAGELLFPERFSEARVEALKNNLGPYGYSAQYQQRPTPTGGGIIKRDWWQLWPADEKLPKVYYVVQSMDCAFSDKKSADNSAVTVWGLFRKDSKVNAILLDAWAEKLIYPDLLKKAIELWEDEYGDMTNGAEVYGRRANALLVENKSAGHGLIPDLRMRNINATPIERNRATGDKVSRVHSALPYLANGQMWVMESKKRKGQPVSWAEPFVKECEMFRPGGTGHDDYVDTWSQAVLWLKASRLLDIHEDDRAKSVPHYPQYKPQAIQRESAY